MMNARCFSFGSAIVAFSVLLAGCGPSTGNRPKSPSAKPVPAKPRAVPKAEGKTGEAVAALWRGDSAKAEKALRKILQKTPNDKTARSLLRQITEDPRKLLGSDSYPYKVKAGETLWGLSQRVLGDPMMFYALARYNDIAVPQSLTAGSMIRIPGKLRSEAPPPKPIEKPSPAPAPAPAPTPAPTPPPPPPAPVAHDPAGATKLRAAGLAAMNKGAIDRAVLLLRQAQKADPSNTLVARDLDRARKIQAAVHRR